MASNRITLLDPLARVTVRDERIVVRTVGVQGPPGPPTITPGAVVTAEGDLIVGGPGGTPIALPGPAGTWDRSIYLAYNSVSRAPELRQAPYLDVNDVPLLGGETNDIGRFQRALDAADFVFVGPKIGGGPWLLPYIEQEVVAGVGAGVTWIDVHGGKTILGAGRHAPIYGSGGDTAPLYAGNTAAQFVVRGDQRGVIFENLFFYGDNGSWADTEDYVFGPGNGSTAVLVSHDDASNRPEDVTVRGCEFEFLFGFPVHDYTTLSRRTSALDCAYRYCGNGFNICSHGTVQVGNRVLHSEGFEAIGRNAIIAYNLFEETQGGVVAYGGAGEDQPGGIVAFNTADSCTQSAYSIADGVYDFTFVGNSVGSVPPFYAALRFDQAFGDEYLPHDVLVASNFLAGYVDARAPRTTFVGNRFDSLTEAAHVYVRAEDQIFEANRFIGAARPIYIAPGVYGAHPTNLYFGASNMYDPFAFSDDSGGELRFAEGSHLRLTARPTANVAYRGTTVAVEGGSGVADTLDRGEKNAANTHVWRPVTEGASSHGTASVADGGTIAHGLGVTPGWVGLTPKVGGRIAVVAGLTSTNITIDLKDHAGTDIAVAEDVLWRAEV